MPLPDESVRPGLVLYAGQEGAPDSHFNCTRALGQEDRAASQDLSKEKAAGSRAIKQRLGPTQTEAS